MMSLWDALRMNMMISYQELVRTFPREVAKWKSALDELKSNELISSRDYKGVQFEVTHKGWTLFESLKNK